MSTFTDILRAGTKSAESVVEKVWGRELIQTNNELFCLKYLVFFKGGKISRHYHCKKTEQIKILCGILGARITSVDGVDKKYIVRAGDSIDLPVGTIHQLECFEDAILIEVSTQDFSSDSIRLEPSSFDVNNDENIKNYE